MWHIYHFVFWFLVCLFFSFNSKIYWECNLMGFFSLLWRFRCMYLAGGILKKIPETCLFSPLDPLPILSLFIVLICWCLTQLCRWTIIISDDLNCWDYTSVYLQHELTGPPVYGSTADTSWPLSYVQVFICRYHLNRYFFLQVELGTLDLIPYFFIQNQLLTLQHFSFSPFRKVSFSSVPVATASTMAVIFSSDPSMVIYFICNSETIIMKFILLFTSHYS